MRRTARCRRGGGGTPAPTRSSSRRPRTRRPSTRPSPTTARLPGRPADLRGSGRHRAGHRRPGTAAGRELGEQRGRPDPHLHAPRGREVPRRHRLQRRGGVRQLRPVEQLHRGRCRARASPTTGRRSWAGSPPATTRRWPTASTAAARPTSATEVDDHAQPALRRLHPGAVAAVVRHVQPRRAREVQAPTRSPAPARRPQFGRVRQRPPHRHRAVQVRLVGPRPGARAHRQRGLLGREAKRSPGSCSAIIDDTDRPQQALESRLDRRLRPRRAGRRAGARRRGLPDRQPRPVQHPLPGHEPGRPRDAATSRSARPSPTRSTRRRWSQAQLPEGTELATQFIPPASTASPPDVATYDYDPERAKALLAEAGFAEDQLELPFNYPTGVSRPYMPTPEETFTAIRADLEAVGIVVNPVGEAVEPGLPRRDPGHAPRRGTPPARAGPVTTTTPTTSSGCSSARRPRSGASTTPSCSPRSPRPAGLPADEAEAAYQDINRTSWSSCPASRWRTRRRRWPSTQRVGQLPAEPGAGRGLQRRDRWRGR